MSIFEEMPQKRFSSKLCDKFFFSNRTPCPYNCRPIVKSVITNTEKNEHELPNFILFLKEALMYFSLAKLVNEFHSKI